MRKVIFIVTLLAINFLYVTNAFAETNLSSPTLASEAAIIVEANTGEILFEKDANELMYPASLTKIATAIYAIENGRLEDIVTVSSDANRVEGTKVYLEVGEKVSLKKLLQGLLINSGNDAGVAIAEHLSGSVELFSHDLNTYLKNVVGVENTNFENPHGLFNTKHMTTAEDLAKITQYAMKNNTFKEIFSTKELEWNGESWDTTLITHHKILKGEIPYEGVTGGKTGYVDQSGFTLATTADNDNLSLIVITLKSSTEKDAYQDTEKLLDYGFENFASIKKGTVFTVGVQKYKTSHTLNYISPLNEQINKKVNEDGTLNIFNHENTLIATFQLEKINREIQNQINNKKEMESLSKDSLNNEIIHSIYLTILYTLVALNFYFWVNNLAKPNKWE